MKSDKKIKKNLDKRFKNINPRLENFSRLGRKEELDVDDLVEQLRNGDRKALSTAITLVESKHPRHKALANEVIERCILAAGRSIRIGITGTPGVGKSSFIEQVGQHILKEDHKIAILTIDPSSQLTGGSILGDKTRMQELAKNQDVYIRPTPAGDSLGGVAKKTRETILLCEAAGFDIVLIETVGVGQSETMVHAMVDVFVLLLLPGAGDELQGMKRGVMEMADVVVVNKADGQRVAAAKATAAEYQNAIHLFPVKESGQIVSTLTCSSLTGEGVDMVWKEVKQLVEFLKNNGYFDENRRKQATHWLDQTIRDNLINAFFTDTAVRKAYEVAKKAVLDGKKSPFAAAEEVVAIIKK